MVCEGFLFYFLLLVFKLKNAFILVKHFVLHEYKKYLINKV